MFDILRFDNNNFYVLSVKATSKNLLLKAISPLPADKSGFILKELSTLLRNSQNFVQRYVVAFSSHNFSLAYEVNPKLIKFASLEPIKHH